MPSGLSRLHTGHGLGAADVPGSLELVAPGDTFRSTDLHLRRIQKVGAYKRSQKLFLLGRKYQACITTHFSCGQPLDSL